MAVTDQIGVAGAQPGQIMPGAVNPNPVPIQAKVIWTSNPGDCLFSYEHVFATGDEGELVQTLTVPTFPGASPSTCLFFLVSASNGYTGMGTHGGQYIDALGVSHSPSYQFTHDNGGDVGSWYDGGQLGGLHLYGFSNVGTGGGQLTIRAGSYYLNGITGVVIRSVNGVAVACAVDPSSGGSLAYADGGPLSFWGNSNSPAVTASPFSGLSIAGAGALGINPISVVPGLGWVDLVSDTQIITQSGGNGALWQPNTVTLSASFDPTFTPPPYPACAWSRGASNYWIASMGRVVGAQSSSLSRAQGHIVGQ